MWRKDIFNTFSVNSHRYWCDNKCCEVVLKWHAFKILVLLVFPTTGKIEWYLVKVLFQKLLLWYCVPITSPPWESWWNKAGEIEKECLWQKVTCFDSTVTFQYNHETMHYCLLKDVSLCASLHSDQVLLQLVIGLSLGDFFFCPMKQRIFLVHFVKKLKQPIQWLLFGFQGSGSEFWTWGHIFTLSLCAVNCNKHFVTVLFLIFSCQDLTWVFFFDKFLFHYISPPVLYCTFKFSH